MRPARRLLWALVAAQFLFVPSAWADCSLPLRDALGPHPEQRLPEIAAWTAAATGLPAAEVMPTLAFGTGQDLARIRGGGKLVHRPDDQISLHDPERHVIVLSNEWCGNSDAAWSIVVHEMVHHLQQKAGRRYACVKEQEKLAYAAQEQWLAEHRTSLEAEFGIDPLTRLVRSTCTY